MKVGSVVMFTNSKLLGLNILSRDWYPPVKTIGTVLKVGSSNDIFVQWPSGSTSDDDHWWCSMNDVIELSSKT